MNNSSSEINTTKGAAKRLKLDINVNGFEKVISDNNIMVQKGRKKLEMFRKKRFLREKVHQTLCRDYIADQDNIDIKSNTASQNGKTICQLNGDEINEVENQESKENMALSIDKEGSNEDQEQNDEKMNSCITPYTQSNPSYQNSNKGSLQSSSQFSKSNPLDSHVSLSLDDIFNPTTPDERHLSQEGSLSTAFSNSTSTSAQPSLYPSSKRGFACEYEVKVTDHGFDSLIHLLGSTAKSRGREQDELQYYFNENNVLLTNAIDILVEIYELNLQENDAWRAKTFALLSKMIKMFPLGSLYKYKSKSRQNGKYDSQATSSSYDGNWSPFQDSSGSCLSGNIFERKEDSEKEIKKNYTNSRSDLKPIALEKNTPMYPPLSMKRGHPDSLVAIPVLVPEKILTLLSPYDKKDQTLLDNLMNNNHADKNGNEIFNGNIYEPNESVFRTFREWLQRIEERGKEFKQQKKKGNQRQQEKSKAKKRRLTLQQVYQEKPSEDRGFSFLRGIINNQFQLSTIKRIQERVILTGGGYADGSIGFIPFQKGNSEKLERWKCRECSASYVYFYIDKVKLILELKKCHGVGPVTAKKWADEILKYQMNQFRKYKSSSKEDNNLSSSGGNKCTSCLHPYTFPMASKENDNPVTLSDLELFDIATFLPHIVQQASIKVSKPQTIGLKYFHDFQMKMDRQEVSELSEIVKQAMKSICRDMEVIVCGSYRRGKQKCGDMDILFAPPSNYDTAEKLLDLVSEEIKDEWNKKGMGGDTDIDMGLLNEEKEEAKRNFVNSWRYCSPLDFESDSEDDEIENEVSNFNSIKFYRLCDTEQEKHRRLKQLLSLILRKCINLLSQPNYGNGPPINGAEGFLTAHLTMSYSRGYMGVCKRYLPLEERNLMNSNTRNFFSRGPARRIDMKVYTREEYPTAILYFTGSAYFNRSMRHYAKKIKNVSLGDRWAGPKTDVNTPQGETVKMKFKDEKDIFRQLNLPYIEPYLRNH